MVPIQLQAQTFITLLNINMSHVQVCLTIKSLTPDFDIVSITGIKNGLSGDLLVTLN